MTPTALARIFSVCCYLWLVRGSFVARFFLLQLDVDSVWLRKAGVGAGRQAFFPDPRNQRFNFTSDVGYFVNHFVVEGNSPRAPTPTTRAVVAGSSRMTSRGPGTVIPVGRKSSVNVKIVQASMKKSVSGCPDFKPLGQMFIDINEATANVNYLSHAVKEKWGNEYVLVTSDAIKIEDSSGTQGGY